MKNSIINKILIISILTGMLNVSIGLGYSPDYCNITNYDLTFLYDNNQGVFKVHGCWPEICSDCVQCGYPQCCDIKNVVYTYPSDPTNFITQYWFNTTTTEECTGTKDVILFEHEYMKHISCAQSQIGNTTSFLSLMIQLYSKYYDNYVMNQCNGYEQLWINVDADFNYIKTTCK
jgi:ribonuclease I